MSAKEIERKSEELRELKRMQEEIAGEIDSLGCFIDGSHKQGFGDCFHTVQISFFSHRYSFMK